MSQATISVELPDNLMQDALQSAAREGKSLHQWVRSAQEFFKKRAAGATGEELRWALEHAPDRPADPGDEL